jgi:hypothetical protein
MVFFPPVLVVTMITNGKQFGTFVPVGSIQCILLDLLVLADVSQARPANFTIRSAWRTEVPYCRRLRFNNTGYAAAFPYSCVAGLTSGRTGPILASDRW